LQNDNDFIYYTFGAGYRLKSQRFQLDITYFRDRFNGADTQAVGTRPGFGFTGQKHDSVLLMPSWSGTLGPVRALVQGNILLGTARGGTTAGLPRGAVAGQEYDIFAGAVVAYVEADFGIVRPFVGLVYGSGDGDPTDDKLHGFTTLPVQEITLITATPFFAHLDTSNGFAVRDYSCPARAQGVRPAARPTDPATAVGAEVLAGALPSAPGVIPAFSDCAHTTGNPFNDSLGNTSHLGLRTTYSNPGTLVIPAGIRFFPLRGHEITGWYLYRAMVDTSLLEIAFAPELAGRGISKGQYHEIGGFWAWALNSHFDIRLSGNVALPGEGYKDLARLATCNGRPCQGGDVALAAEARFRARF
jgi:hypothetical protein